MADQKSSGRYQYKETAGPNNNWMDPKDAKTRMTALFDGGRKGRTMYVMPYVLGHLAAGRLFRLPNGF